MTRLTDEQMAYAKHLQASAAPEPSKLIQDTHSALSLIPHPEGGYFAETDRDKTKVPNPFHGSALLPNASAKPPGTDSSSKYDTSEERNASTTIHYLLDTESPMGIFHRNKGRTVHTLHRGRGIYVLIHAKEVQSNSNTSRGKARIEIFTVGPDIVAGEKLQWIVEGGIFKASFLLPDIDCEESRGGLLISETVVPGFEFADHDFLTLEGMRELLSEEDFEMLSWLLRKEEREKI